MQTEKMKNMIILKNLPSNIIDEAFIILKGNQKAKILNALESSIKNSATVSQPEGYIVKEAEMILNNYLSKIENEKYVKSNYVRTLEKKYKKLKLISIILFITILLIFFT